MHIVAVLVFDDVVASDFATPCDVFRHVRLPDGRPAYQIRICGTAKTVRAHGCAIRPEFGLEGLAGADTIIVPGLNDIDSAINDDLRQAIIDAAVRSTRIASVCSGAFVLAATGLLDGLRATTHWLAARSLAARYPSIIVDPNVLFVDNGQILTSAGAAAAHDLCLHLVRRDYGAAVAADASRIAVMPLERDGGQAQFIVQDATAREEASLEPLLHWMDENLEQSLTLNDLAIRSTLTPRTLNRRFREQVGTTPIQWLLRLRVRRAQYLLESTDYSIERIGSQVGFGSATVFRKHFQKTVGTNPLAYRRAFGHR